jgi:hypothetical protein
MNRTGTILLEFDPHLNKLRKDKKLWDGLSAVVQIGDTLWVANDEALSLERLSRQRETAGGEIRYADHRQFPLHEVLQLPMPPTADSKIEEADIEGLDYDGGYLWLVGSHSLKRGKPDEEDSIEKNTKRLAKVSRDGNRFLLARIPLAEATQLLERTVEQDGSSRTAARLRGDADGNALTEALATDEHLGPFLALPGKDNGFDIEGLAVTGDRVFLGLRGPVLRGWAVLLELAVAEQDASTLTLKPIGADGRPYRKHFLDLKGLGIRDLCVQGSDLLILAGPTMALAGPLTIFRWPGGARPDRESLVFNEALPTVLELPTDARQNACQDQAEGLTLFGLDGGEANDVLVVYDSTAPRRQRETSAVEADLFALP